MLVIMVAGSANESWEQVVPPQEPDEARAAFERWRAQNPEVQPEDIRIDRLYLGPGKGCHVRYHVRRGRRA